MRQELLPSFWEAFAYHVYGKSFDAIDKILKAACFVHDSIKEEQS
jgi:hypothetical protein